MVPRLAPADLLGRTDSAMGAGSTGRVLLREHALLRGAVVIRTHDGPQYHIYPYIFPYVVHAIFGPD